MNWRCYLTFDKLIYPKQSILAEEQFDPTEVFPLWSDYAIVHKQMWSSQVVITQDCLVLNLLRPEKGKLWVEIDGVIELACLCDLEIGR